MTLAALIGGAIGFERQWNQGLAGLRTNTLVAFGAASFMALHVEQTAAYIVTGIGFLCAGVIFREGASVRGLNTATTMWCTAAAGALAGGGLYVTALFCGAGVIAINLGVRHAQTLINRYRPHPVDVETDYLIEIDCAPSRRGQSARCWRAATGKTGSGSNRCQPKVRVARWTGARLGRLCFRTSGSTTRSRRWSPASASNRACSRRAGACPGSPRSAPPVSTGWQPCRNGGEEAMLFTCRPPGTPIPGHFPGPAHARGKWFTLDIHCHVRSAKAAALVEGNEEVSRWFLETQANPRSQAVNRQNGVRTAAQGTSPEQRIADMDLMGIDIQAIVAGAAPDLLRRRPRSRARRPRASSTTRSPRCVGRFPDRFVGLGTIPFQAPGAGRRRTGAAAQIVGLPRHRDHDACRRRGPVGAALPPDLRALRGIGHC